VPDATTTLAELRRRLAEFVAAREWQRYHDAKNLAMAIAIEAAELMEHFQWVRNDELAELLADPVRRAAVADEVADITCFVLGLANALGLDLSDAVVAKMRKNEAKYPVSEFRGQYFRPPRAD
jgi:NTP pyrophosphatase (non-canonical NTP hydrolase)